MGVPDVATGNVAITDAAPVAVALATSLRPGVPRGKDLITTVLWLCSERARRPAGASRFSDGGRRWRENGNGSEGMGEGGGGLLDSLASNGYLVAGLVATVLVGAVLYWLASWTIVDIRPSFEDVLGRALLETSGGVFIGAGLIAALGALRVSG